MMNYKTPIPPEIQNYIDIIEQGKVNVNKERQQLIELVKKAFKTETLKYNPAQIEKYLSYQKYFPFELFEWEVFLFVLHSANQNNPFPL